MSLGVAVADAVAGAGHEPVLLERVRQLLAPALAAPGAVLLDATVGLGGHSAALLADHPELAVIGIDRDPQALERARTRLEPYGSRVRLVRAEHRDLPEVLTGAGHPRVAGILFDLGVSSMQLDLPERGFSYARSAPLDMRMDQSAPLTAADVINDYGVAELSRLLRRYGEERFADRIAHAIVRRRADHRIDSSDELVELVRASIPAAARRSGGNPAKRTFQALRIEVNSELEPLPEVMAGAVDALASGGRIVVLSYHSLEDRVVKRVFADRARDHSPLGLPVTLPGHGPTLAPLTRGAEGASEAEIAANPRAASVRLRAAQRLDGGGGQ